MIKLNAFARQIGISNVYLSYIENDKRPAPTAPIIRNMINALELSKKETTQMLSLASISHQKNGMSGELIKYISQPYVAETLLIALENNVSEDTWAVFQNMIDLKNDSN